MSELEAQGRFNETVKLGIKDGGPIWKFFYVRITNKNEAEESPSLTSNNKLANGTEKTKPSVAKTESELRYVIFFVLSHALVDGIGMTTMVQDYATFACQVLERRKQKLDDVFGTDDFEVLKICPPYEKLVPNLMLYKIAAFPPCLVSDVFLRVLLRFGYAPANRHDIYKSTRLKPLTTNIPSSSQISIQPILRTECIRFSPQEWSNFQKFRRQNGLTVTGLGLSLFAVALMKYAYEGLKWPRTYLGAHVLRDPRLYFKRGELDPRALVGNYIAAGLLLVLPFFRRQHKKPLNRIVVDLAKLITEQIRGNFKNFASFFNGELQSRISRNRKMIQRVVEALSTDRRSEGRFTMIQFSNVGEVKCLDPELCGDYNAVHVEKSIGVADQSKCGDCFCLILSTVQGSLFWSISYPGQMYSQETVRGLGEELKQLWTEVIQPVEEEEQGDAMATDASPGCHSSYMKAAPCQDRTTATIMSAE